MTQALLIAAVAGAAGALLFASIASGSLLSIPLFYLSALPVMIAALGWNHLTGLLAALIGAVALGLAFQGVFALSFLLGIGLPAWWLAYLALLARPVTDASGPVAVNWFPVGRLVAWGCVLAALILALAVVTSAGDAETLRTSLQRAFAEFLRGSGGAGEMSPEQSDSWVLRVLATRPELVFPAAGAALGALTLTLSLWLSARIVRTSGRLRRPWPDITALALPPALGVLLVAAFGATFLSGILGILGTIFLAAMLVAYGLLGLAVVHARTRGLNGRAVVLAALYGAVLVFGWPFILLALLGFADTLFPLRNRADPGGPPALPT